jgi:hypothetical protein
LLLAWNAKEGEIAARANAAYSEAIASQGFLSVKKCKKDELGRDIPSSCIITTPGTAVGALAQKAIGADLDFIVNSQDLAAYIAAISDALINRLVRSGVEGFSGISTPSAPRNQFAGTSCDLFTGRAREDCLEYQSRYLNLQKPSKRVKKATVAEINAALQPRTQAQSILVSLFDLENQLVSNITNLRACQANRNQSVIETDTLLVKHRARAATYQEQSVENSAVISDLQEARSVLEADGSLKGITLLNESDLDTIKAQELLTQLQQDQVTNQPVLIDLNTSIQTRVNQCQSQ